MIGRDGHFGLSVGRLGLSRELAAQGRRRYRGLAGTVVNINPHSRTVRADGSFFQSHAHRGRLLWRCHVRPRVRRGQKLPGFPTQLVRQLRTAFFQRTPIRSAQVGLRSGQIRGLLRRLQHGVVDFQQQRIQSAASSLYAQRLDGVVGTDHTYPRFFSIRLSFLRPSSFPRRTEVFVQGFFGFVVSLSCFRSCSSVAENPSSR